MKPQYLDKYGQPLSAESPSIWERIIGYKPRYVTVPEVRYVVLKERERSKAEQQDRSATERPVE